jgi:hypothetical protein
MLGEEDQSCNPASGGGVPRVASGLRDSFLLRTKEKIRPFRQTRANDVSSRTSAQRLNSRGSVHSMILRIENDLEFALFSAGMPCLPTNHKTKSGSLSLLSAPSFSDPSFNDPRGSKAVPSLPGQRLLPQLHPPAGSAPRWRAYAGGLPEWAPSVTARRRTAARSGWHEGR